MSSRAKFAPILDPVAFTSSVDTRRVSRDPSAGCSSSTAGEIRRALTCLRAPRFLALSMSRFALALAPRHEVAFFSSVALFRCARSSSVVRGSAGRYISSDSKLTLHGLKQYYCKLEEKAKNRKLSDILDSLEFNQVSL